MSKHKVKIAPSLLAANWSNIERDIKQCEEGGADVLHFDSMDGHFVPNITIGPMMVKAVKNVTKLPVSAHLMIENPDFFIKNYIDNGADFVSIHVEGNPHVHRSLQLIREFGAKAGLALNPVTPLEYAFQAAEYCDFILLMSVNPGFGGQNFIPSFMKRATQMRSFLDKNGLEHVEIEVDGGIKINNAAEVVAAGANILVSGTGIFKGDIVANIKAMRERVI
jgi:ribulose-phosphate 3-epimerase